MKQILTLFFSIITVLAYSQETAYLKVHFLYGSKPLAKYKKTESQWFGGLLGGHVGIEVDEKDKVLIFLPSGSFHLFSSNTNKHSTYAVHSVKDFYEIFGGNADSVKKAIVYIPVTKEQKRKFDIISKIYLRLTPYDYAFFGMRCGAATHDILGQLGIMPEYSYTKTYQKIFYPKILRKQLFEKANQNGWKIVRQEGSIKRKWEQD